MPKTLADWLSYQEAIHPSEIDLGLQRVAVVAERLGLEQMPRPVITVAGTNGKGSVVAMLSAIWMAAGYKVASYTSPHLLRYNERIQINAQAVCDGDLVQAFEKIEAARGDVPLTYFEYGTLAALHIFANTALDVIILEVGLGGRLDAVNIIDTDCALITNIELDHQSWLGDTREAIGAEKAGIIRAGKPVCFGARDIPQSIINIAHDRDADLFQFGQHYSYSKINDRWAWIGQGMSRDALPMPSLYGSHQLQNASLALQAMQLMNSDLPVSDAALKTGLTSAKIAGRMQKICSKPQVYVDVCHNPAAAKVLADSLRTNPPKGRTFAIFAALADKDVAGIVAALKDDIDQWYLPDLEAPRALPKKQLATAVQDSGGDTELISSGAADTLLKLLDKSQDHDRIIVFGSFYTVADVLNGVEKAIFHCE